MAELGGTTDPAALVPGDPAALHTTAGTLGRFGDVLAQVGDGLRRIDDGGWTGPAADGFRRFFDGEPTRWLTGADSLHAAGDAVLAYAETLAWAQGQAAAAIHLWARAEQVTEAGVAAHEQRQGQAERAAAAAGEPPPAPVLFTDPGRPLREEARAVLDSARGQLAAAGDDAARIVAEAQRPAPEGPSLLEQAADGLRDAFGDAVEWAGDQTGDAVEAVGEWLDTALDAVGDLADRAVTEAGDRAGAGLERVSEATGIGALAGLGGAVRTGTEEAGDRINRSTDAAGDALRYAADDAGDRLRRAGEDVNDYLEDDDDGGLEGGDDDGDDGSTDEAEEDTEDQEEPEPATDEEDERGDVDRNGQWEDANGDKPDPEHISAEDARAHILYGDGDEDGGGHRHDSGVPGKTTFPPDWDDDKIIDEVEDVARNPDSPPVYNEQRETWVVRGTRDGVDIEVIVTPEGEVRTAYPTGGEGVHRNDENGDPQPLD